MSPQNEEEEHVICHSLPCNIDYSGIAPVKSYLHPTTIDAPSTSSKVMACQFRGRGLLALHESLPPNLHGVVAETSNNTSQKEGKGQVKVMATFDSMCEWHHEHDVRRLTHESHVKEGSTLYRAQQWCDLASAIHDPIL
uniref:Uncharacterized protein n=1 Tax=Ditylum brightwellii TaxID=49249 RepID=A0A6U3NRN2_9STRA|mmetsp:Transcript_11383/g.16968  ORF Transcript_11383/g.16968 Transcript_11383/m.16968 type:complete len:139 (+) Transcript_11383:87-503(+)